jgi:transposase
MTFSELGINPPDEIVADDLLAVSLLDITWRPQVLRVLLMTHRQQFSALLADIPQDLDLWDATDGALRHIDLTWDALTSIEGIGTASATKILARKRPRICPISDNLVIKAVDVPGRTWDVLRCLLQDSDARADVEALRPDRAAAASLLRILDVALWVSHSRSAAAQELRLEAGMAPVSLTAP